MWGFCLLEQVEALSLGGVIIMPIGSSTCPMSVIHVGSGGQAPLKVDVVPIGGSVFQTHFIDIIGCFSHTFAHTYIHTYIHILVFSPERERERGPY